VSPQVGFNKGDGIRYYEHPWALTSGVLQLNVQTNTGVTGRWLYRVDGNIVEGNTTCVLPPSVGKYDIVRTGEWRPVWDSCKSCGDTVE